MTLQNAICDYSNNILKNEIDWYDWKINKTKLPIIIEFSRSCYENNLNLKYALHEAWLNPINNEQQGELIKYYIQDWGGIRTNRISTMEIYKTGSANQFFLRGINGIASWSKALVLHNPYKYAIYDARVAVSLNCLQILNNVEEKYIFPLLPSRNNLIIEANHTFRNLFNQEWSKVNNQIIYHKYLEILSECGSKIGQKISTIEMILFAKAEDLANQVLQNHKPKLR